MAKYRAGRCPTSCGIYCKTGSEQNADGSYTSSAMQWMRFSSMEDGVRGYFYFINTSNYANIIFPSTGYLKMRLTNSQTCTEYVMEHLPVIPVETKRHKQTIILNIKEKNI